LVRQGARPRVHAAVAELSVSETGSNGRFLCNREGEKVTVGEVISTGGRMLKTLFVPDPGQCVGAGASALGCPLEIVAALPLPTKAVKLGKLPDLVKAANRGGSAP
jgi:hypothetical protein